MRALFLVAALVGAAGLIAGVNQPPGQKKDDKKADDKKDPQSTFEPKSKPGAGQKFLERFVGDWDVTKSFFPRGGGEPSKQKGECRQTMIHGGRFLQSEFTFQTADGGKSTGTGTIGFEPETGKFTSTWIDSRQTRMSFRQGEEKFDGEQIVLHGKELGGPEARKSRTVTKLEDDGKRIVHRQFGTGPDGMERPVMELVMTKKAAPAK